MHDIHLCGQHLQAHPQRALYWPAHGMLLLADLHLGKADTFRQFGIGIPHSVQTQDLARLALLLQELRPQRCLVLGDLVHGRTIGADTAKAWNDLLQQHTSTQFELILGNHDRALQADTVQLHQLHTGLQIENVYLSHEPIAAANWPAGCQLNIHGHLHAAVRINGSRSKLPALTYQAPHLSMPAFSEFTAGALPQGPSQHIWVFAPQAGGVVQLR